MLVRQGRLDPARPLLDEALVTARAVSDDELVGLVLRELGRIACRSGDLASGLEAFEQAMAVFEEIDEPEEVPATELAACEGLLLAGDAPGCLARLDALPRPDDDALVPMLHRLRGTALLAAGRPDAAVAELTAGLEAARAEDNRFEEALTRLALARVARTPSTGHLVPDEDPQALDPRAILAGLGVVALPLPPGLLPD